MIDAAAVEDAIRRGDMRALPIPRPVWDELLRQVRGRRRAECGADRMPLVDIAEAIGRTKSPTQMAELEMFA